MIAAPTLHPAFLLRSTEGEGGAAVFEETVSADIFRAICLLRRKPVWNEDVIWEKDGDRLKNLRPTVQEVWKFCEGARGQLVAVDVETSGEHPLSSRLLCVGLAREDGRAICVPWLDPGGVEYWHEHDKRKVWEILRYFLAGGWGARLIFHNGPFDSVVLWAYGWDCFAAWEHDTMQARHVLDSELPLGLDYLASRYTEIVYYKDAVKGDVRWVDLDWVTLRSYNLRDVLCTIRPWAQLSAELKQAGATQWALYLEEIQLAKEMARATIRGIYVDQYRKYRLSRHLQRTRVEHLGILQGIARNAAFNPGSPEQLKEILFQRLGFPVVKRTDKGSASTDKDAMVLLALHAQTQEQVQFLQSLVSWRKAAKLASTWVGEWEGPDWAGEEFDTGKRKKDGTPIMEWRAIEAQPAGVWLKGLPMISHPEGLRVHPSWKLMTKTGRFSSSPNAQNWTTAIKKMFCAPEGRELVGLDLNQAELRMTAYFTNDADLLLMYQRGINVHTANCSLVLQTRSPGLDTNDATEEYLREAVPRLIGLRYEDLPVCPESQWKSKRTLVKNFVFGDIYGAEAETLYEVIRSKRDPETDKLLFPNIQLDQIQAAKIIWEQTHPAIPAYWKAITRDIQARGYYECPISGRRRYFKGGFKRNEMLNNPNQIAVGSRMNKGTLRIASQLPSGSGINIQVHDMLGAECAKGDGKEIARLMDREFDRTFPLAGFPEAILPTDWKNGEGAKIGKYVDEI